MSGLILKDLLNLKKQGKIYLIFLAFYLFISFTSKESAAFTTMIIVISSVIPVTAASYDERAHFDKYALSMPVNRNDIVLGKYVLGIICMIVATILSMLVNIITNGFNTHNILLSLAYGGAGIIIISILLPIIFKVGTEKARMIMMIVFLAPTILVLMISKMGIQMPSKEAIENLLKYLPYIGTAMVLVFLIVSILISLKVYKNKDL